jgi:Aspartyl protease
VHAKLRTTIAIAPCLVETASRANGAQFLGGHATISGRAMWLASLVILSLASVAYIPVVHAACRLDQIAEFNIEWVGNSPVVDGHVNGQPIRILLETGSTISFITNKAAHQLNLPIREYRNREIVGVGGDERVETAVVKELQIGGLVIKDYTVEVVATDIHDAGGVAVFQVGADFLSHFTTELDLAHGVVRLLHPQDCKLEQLAYWTPSYFRIDVAPFSPDTPSLVLHIKLNGKSMNAALVSGDAISFVRPQSARNAGVEPGGLRTEPLGDIMGLRAQPIPTWIGRFDSLEVGGETIMNARLRIGDVFPNFIGGFGPHNQVDMKLGSDFLKANRLIIVPGKDVILFTFNGGAVFQRERVDEADPRVPDGSLPLDKGSATLQEN